MNTELGTYSFLPWLRQGIANNIQTADGDNSVKLRGTIDVVLTLTGEGIGEPESEPISKTISLYGPGDIIGIESRAIIKTEPRNWITNFEPNYTPYIDFYDEDFPWRYTPAAPDTGLGRLRPWIMLVVLSEDEFTDGTNIAGKPLPYITVPDAGNVFPPADQLWAWAHVHVNEDIVNLTDNVESNDVSAVLQQLKDVLTKNPDLAYSRILCPRKLAPNSPYHAFLIPVFESGRLAGLGSDIPADTIATASSWDNGQAEFPYYHRWYFRTGTVGDFEYLVRLLEPKPVDARVGRRDMDVQKPAPNISGIGVGEDDGILGGILKLGGALQVPFKTMTKDGKADVLVYDNWDRLDQLKYESWDRLDQLTALSDEELNNLFITRLDQTKPHEFQTDLTAFINLADDYSEKVAAEANRASGLDTITQEDPEDPDDPLITPPLYGRWHAMVRRLLEESSQSQNWIHELNLDPRWRVAAGFGTKVVQEKQEEYMDAAWGQVGELLEANRKIRFAQFAKETSWIFYSKHVTPLKQHGVERAFSFTAPLQKRILLGGATVYHRMNTSHVPCAVSSAPMRRIVRPSSRLMRLLPFEGIIRPDNLIERINREDVHPAPPKQVPESLPTLEDLSEDLKPDNLPGFLTDLLSRIPWLQYLPLLLLILLLLLFIIFGLTGISAVGMTALAAASVSLFVLLRKLTRRIQDAESVLEENQRPEAVDELPRSPDFRITDMAEGFTPSRGATDSAEALRFKAALRDTHELVQLSGEVGATPKLEALDVNLMVEETFKGIYPELTIPRLVLNHISIPAHISTLIGEGLKEAMAYPELDIPMYKPLANISAELFLPNINFIEQNSISLLETNQRFIESYMVGLNHEFARELLWREFPTDQRGSYFRQFWDVSGYLDTENLDEEALKEKLRDIPPLHEWMPPRRPPTSKLGEHDHRQKGKEKKEEAVLVIRGELLKKYPTAVIYAHKAAWHRKEDGTIDNTRERYLVELTEAEHANPPRDKVKTPLYEAKVDPDIYFFGFDLTIEEAKGGTGEDPGDEDRPGWFFPIKERPGEPRFGLDIDREGAINVWNDLSWEDVVPGVAQGDFIRIEAGMEPINLDDPYCDREDPRHDPELEEKCDQYEDDKHLTWHEDMNAAEVAYILYQAPVLVAVHGAEMLPKQ